MNTTFSLITILKSIEDPRVDRTKLHSLTDILFIAVCSSICGMCGWEDFQAFAEHKEEWFRKFIPLKNGVPSHDTFRRVFERLNPKQLQLALAEMNKVLAGNLEGKVVAIDGKTLKGSLDTANGIAAIHTVSAWASESRVVLGECDTEAKSNEITAIPSLLKMIEVKGAIITIDAMGCQKQIAKQIVKENKADYVFTLKKNHPDLYNAVDSLFKNNEFSSKIQSDEWQTFEKVHGRVESRTCSCIDAKKWLPHITQEWTGLATVARIIATRDVKGRYSKETRYFISSLPCDAQKIGQAIREHWSIENVLHWSLDVVYHEDSIQIRRDNAPKNLAVIRRMAFSLAKPRTPAGMTTKRAQLISILSQKFAECHFLAP